MLIQEINFIITYSVVFLLLLPIFYIRMYRVNLKRKYNYSVYYVKSVLGWIIGINGDIRMGKTSLLSGLSSLCQIVIMGEIQDMMEKTMRIFKRIDFNRLNQYLMEIFNEHPYPDFDQLTEAIMDAHKLKGEGLHYNMVGQVKIQKLILDYIFGLYVLNVRNNYVQSKTPFYSNVTHNFSLGLNIEWLKIREAYKNKDYAILDWMVILIDELTDEAGAMTYMDDLKDLAGAKEYRRKFGQIHQERNRMISTKQDVMDEVKKYRNLTHSNLIIDEKVSTLGNHKWLLKIITHFNQLPIKLLNWFVINPRFIWSKITRKGLSKYDIQTYYHQKIGIDRKQANKLYYYQQFFLSIGYNKYYGYKIKRAEDIERVTSDRDEFALYIPTPYCWGTYDTHLYKNIQNELLSNSNITAASTNPFVIKPFFNDEAMNQENERKEVEDLEF